LLRVIIQGVPEVYYHRKTFLKCKLKETGISRPRGRDKAMKLDKQAVRRVYGMRSGRAGTPKTLLCRNRGQQGRSHADLLASGQYLVRKERCKSEREGRDSKNQDQTDTAPRLSKAQRGERKKQSPGSNSRDPRWSEEKKTEKEVFS